MEKFNLAVLGFCELWDVSRSRTGLYGEISALERNLQLIKNTLNHLKSVLKRLQKFPPKNDSEKKK